MVRVDVWDIPRADADDAVMLNLPQSFHDTYILGRELGRGGFGVVKVATDRFNGQQLACKIIQKRLSVPNLAAAKQAQHLDKITREIEVLRRLRGSLNVAQLKGAYEDAECVYITMEWCTGGELWHRIGRAHYSEQTASSYMRAVLRTIAQCHNKRILHRDIKPGNFMLLSDSPKAPIKAIDFGLAVFYTEKELPRTDLGLEGTPWYMAPEVLECSVGPPADVWAAGVMAYQLLSGYLPFDDRANPRAPAVSKIWQAIFGQEPKMKGSPWANISQDAKDFVRTLLNKDPKKRPTAREALNHAWLQHGSAADRTHGKALDRTVVQRIQHFSQGNVLRKTIFELIAGELLKAADVQPGSEMQRKCSGSGQSMQQFRKALSRQITPIEGPRQSALPQEPDSPTAADQSSPATSPADKTAGGGASTAGRPSVSFAPIDSSSSSKRVVPDSGGQEARHPATDALRECSHTGAVRSMSTSALDNVALVAKLSNKTGDQSYRNKMMFEAARQRADLGVTAGGSAHAGLQYYGAIEGYDGAHTSIGRTFPGERHKGVGCKRPNTVHGGRSYFGGPALGPLKGNSRYRLMRAAAAAGRLPGHGFETSDYVHLAPRTASERYEQRKAARLSLDTSFAGATAHHALSMNSFSASEDNALMDVDELSILPTTLSSHEQRQQLSVELSRQQQQRRSSERRRGDSQLDVPATSIASSKGGENDTPGTQGGRSLGLYKAYVEGGTPGSQMDSPMAGSPPGRTSDSVSSMGGDQDAVEAYLDSQARVSMTTTPTAIDHPSSRRNDFMPEVDARQQEAASQLTALPDPDTSRPGSAPAAVKSGQGNEQRSSSGQTTQPNDQSINAAAASTAASEALSCLPAGSPFVQALAEDGSWHRGGLIGAHNDGLARLQRVSMEGRPPRRSPSNEARNATPCSPLVSQPSTPRAPPYANAGPFVGGSGRNASGVRSREGSGSGRAGYRSGFYGDMAYNSSVPRTSIEAEEYRQQEGVSRTIEALGRRSMEAPASSQDLPAVAPGWPDSSGVLPGEKYDEAMAARSRLSPAHSGHLEGSRHGGSQRGSGSGAFALAAATRALQESQPSPAQASEDLRCKQSAFAAAAQRPPGEGSGSGSRRGADRHVRFGSDTAASDDSPESGRGGAVRSRLVQGEKGVLEVPPPGSHRGGHIAVPKEVHDLMSRLHFSPEEEGVAAGRLAEGLQRLGYALEEGEAERLLETAAGTTSVPKAKFLASQIDWGAYQMNFREQWLLAAKRAFDAIEGAASSLPGGSGSTSRGAVNSKALIDLLRQRLPWAEVDYAVEDALLEAGAVDADEIDFEGFLRLMRVDSEAQLDQYESRHHGGDSHHGGSSHRGNLFGSSTSLHASGSVSKRLA